MISNIYLLILGAPGPAKSHTSNFKRAYKFSPDHLGEKHQMTVIHSFLIVQSFLMLLIQAFHTTQPFHTIDDLKMHLIIFKTLNHQIINRWNNVAGKNFLFN